MNENDKVPSVLCTWASEEMGFIDKRLDSTTITGFPDKISPIDWNGLCLGPMSDVWSYIVTHVKSTSTVELIKGNLKLHPSEPEPENNSTQSLLEQKKNLQKDLQELENKKKNLSEQLGQAQLQYGFKIKFLNQRKISVRDYKRSMFLVNILTKRVQHQTAALQDSSLNVEAKINRFIPAEMEDGNKDRFKIDFSKMSKMMEGILAELFCENPNLERIHALKQDVGSYLATLFSNIPHPYFLRLLEEYQEADTQKLSHLLTMSGEFGNHSLDLLQHSVQSVQRLLYEISWFYVDLRCSSDQKNKSTQHAQRQLLYLTTKVRQLLASLFQGKDDLLKISLELIDLKLKHARHKATVKALQRSSAEMLDTLSSLRNYHAEVEAKSAEIEKREHLASTYSALICCLAKKHVENSDLIMRETKSLRSLLNVEVPSLHQLLITNAISVRKQLECGENFFYTKTPSKFFHTQLNGMLIPVDNLAVNRMRLVGKGALSTCLENTMLVNNILMTSAFEAHQSLTRKTMNKLMLRQITKWYSTRISEVDGKYKLFPETILFYNELVSTAQERRTSLEENLSPTIISRVKKIEEASKFVLKVEKAISEWINEPAQTTDTRYLRNGLSLDQWRTNLTHTMMSLHARHVE